MKIIQSIIMILALIFITIIYIISYPFFYFFGGLLTEKNCQ